MNDDDAHSPDSRDSPPSRLQLLWEESWSYLLAGLAISLVLHLLSLGLFFLSPPRTGDVDVEWMGRFGDLTGIGHGMEDFRPEEEVDWDELATLTPDEEEGAEEQGDPQEEIPEEIEEDIQDEIEDDGEEEMESASEAVEVGAGEEPQESPRDAQEERAAPVAERETPPREEPREPQRQRAQLEGIPGVDRSSPSNLPDLRNYGPGNARMTALVRLDRLRGTSLEPHINTLLAVVPDYRILLDGTGVQAVQDLDTLFMASADPTHLHQTFLAARYSMSTEEMQAILDRRFADPLDWETDGAYPVRPLVPTTGRYRDPRRIMLTDQGLAMVGRPEWFSELIGPVDPSSPLGQELAAAEAGPSAFQLLDGLARIEEVAEGEDTLVLVSAYGLIFFAPGVGRLPRFEAVRLSVRNPSRPHLTIDLRFATSVLARDFARSCPNLKRQIIGGIPFARTLGVASIVDRLSCEHDGDYVTVEGTYTTQELTNLLQLATPFIPRPPALTGLPPGPSPPPSAATPPEDSEGPDSESNSQEESHDEALSPQEMPSLNRFERPGKDLRLERTAPSSEQDGRQE